MGHELEKKEDHVARWMAASADPWAGAVGTIRGLTYREITGDEFREAVIAVLDACEEVNDLRLKEMRST